MHRTPYKVVGTPEDADTILEGTINYADKNIVVESPFNLPRELNGTVSVGVKWTHNPPTEAEKTQVPTIIMPRPSTLFPKSARPRSQPSIGSTRTSRPRSST